MENNRKKIGFVIIAVVAVLVLGGLSLWKRIPQRIWAKLNNISVSRDVTVYDEQIDIDGFDDNFKIIYVSDTHVALCDERDTTLMQAQKDRYEEFSRDSKGPDRNFEITLKYIIKEKPDLVIFGGDITDEATEESIDFLEKEMAKIECPYIYLMGNHDFKYGDEYFSQKSYDDYLPRLKNVNGDSDGIEVLRFEDFTVLALDDNNNQVPQGTTEILEELKNEGKPVIVALHVPIVPPDGAGLIAATNEVWPPAYLDYSRVLMGEHANQPNEETAALISFITAEDSCVAGVLAGHIHFYAKDSVNPRAFQVTAPAGYERAVLIINVN